MGRWHCPPDGEMREPMSHSTREGQDAMWQGTLQVKRSWWCYYCRRPGHLMRECKTLKYVTALLNPEGGAEEKGEPLPTPDVFGDQGGNNHRLLWLSMWPLPPWNSRQWGLSSLQHVWTTLSYWFDNPWPSLDPTQMLMTALTKVWRMIDPVTGTP